MVPVYTDPWRGGGAGKQATDTVRLVSSSCEMYRCTSRASGMARPAAPCKAKWQQALRAGPCAPRVPILVLAPAPLPLTSLTTLPSTPPFPFSLSLSSPGTVAVSATLGRASPPTPATDPSLNQPKNTRSALESCLQLTAGGWSPPNTLPSPRGPATPSTSQLLDASCCITRPTSRPQYDEWYTIVCSVPWFLQYCLGEKKSPLPSLAGRKNGT